MLVDLVSMAEVAVVKAKYVDIDLFCFPFCYSWLRGKYSILLLFCDSFRWKLSIHT